jgi:N6-L-threonylcarbamoyladenine synthase
MYILGIESSCDESAASVIQLNKKGDFQVLSDVIFSQIDIHKEYGGVVPEIAAREHLVSILPCIDQSLEKAKIKAKDISAIAITSGPGLITSLISASETAKALSFVWDKPIIPINHIEGHIYSAFIEHKEKIEFPALILTVSGGHNILISMKDHFDYKIIGQTLDDAAGEAFDKAAKMMKLGYPGGPIISKLADSYKKKEEIDLPRPMMHSKNLDFSFSGLKTALLYKLKKDRNWSKKIPQYCYSFQKAVVDVLVSKTLKAISLEKTKSVLLVGGVSANKALKKELNAKIRKKYPDINFIAPSLKYSGDNAVMIALAGTYHFSKNPKRMRDYKSVKISSNLSLNDKFLK